LSGCKHYSSPNCTHPVASVYRAAVPTPRDCAGCAWYDGPARGAGDLVASVTKFTGVAKLVHIVVPDCGCPERQAKLNEMLPLKDQS
jgi:hypothetical protein